MDEHIAARRHAALGDRVGGVVGLAVVRIPGGEVELVAALLDVAGQQPGERRQVALRRPAGLPSRPGMLNDALSRLPPVRGLSVEV